MCGRYAQGLRPSRVRQMLQDDNMPVYDAPADDGDGAPRQSYNFAPGYHGIVYRAHVPDWGAGPLPRGATAQGDKTTQAAPFDEEGEEDGATVTVTANEQGHPHYILQSMKWGLVPFWTKRNPDYATMMKTINCRDDSLAQKGGMWASMKGRKRCLVLAQGFYEWLKTGKDKMPHYVRRKDGRLMCLAGLWDHVQYQGSGQKHYTYTIITTDSNKQLKFLHDRMPVILNQASDEMITWLDPTRYEWSQELQGALKPFDGELEIYPVNKEVGKVGNDSPSFIIPIASRENKRNIANFFPNAPAKGDDPTVEAQVKEDVGGHEDIDEAKRANGAVIKIDGESVEASSASSGRKRKGDSSLEEELGLPVEKEAKSSRTTAKTTPMSSKPAQRKSRMISATSNESECPIKKKTDMTPKITGFFRNSA